MTFTLREPQVHDILIRSWSFALRAEGLSPRTVSNYERHVEVFAEWLEQERGQPLTTATVHDARAFSAHQGERSPFVANMAWRGLRSFYRWCAAEGECANIADRIKQPKSRESREECHGGSVPQTHRLLHELRVVRHSRRRIFAVLRSTGLRRTELANLVLDDVNLKDGTVLVRESKNGSYRVAYLTTNASKHLLAWLRARAKLPQARESNRIWLGKFGPLTSDGIREAIERRAKYAGVDVSAHDFRRALAERWLMKGGGESALMSVAGWKNSAMPRRYSRGASQAIAQAEFRCVIEN